MWDNIEKYVNSERANTAGFVVINRAYLLNCVLPESPGINNCKFPAKWPNKNTTKKSPDKEAKTFLNIVEVKYVFNLFYSIIHDQIYCISFYLALRFIHSTL